MTDVFLSYNRKEAARAQALRELLDRRGCTVWFDQRDLPVSAPWLEEIEVAIRSVRLVVILDSRAWRDSENCLAEAEIAGRWRVPVLRVPPGGSPQQEAELVAARLGRLTAADQLRTDARAMTGKWLEAGRPTSRLARGRGLTALRRAAEEQPEGLPRTAWEFLRVSAKQQRRRTALAYGAFLVTAGLVVTAFATDDAFRRVEGRIDEAIARNATSTAYSTAAEDGPFAVLETYTTADDPGLTGRYHVAAALSAHLPVDARPAGPGGPPRHTADSPDGRLRAEVGPGARIRVLDARTDEVVATSATSATARTLAWSPDSAHVAAGVADTVEIVSARRASPPRILTGGRGTVRGVAWSGDTVRAVTDAGLEIDWHMGSDRLVVDPSRWFVAAAPVSDDEVAVLDRGGDLLLVDPTGRTPVRTIATGAAQATGLTVDADSRTAVVVGEQTVVVDLDDGRVRPLEVPDCTVTAADFTGDGDGLVVGCSQFTLLALRDGAVASFVELPALPVSVSAAGTTVVVGDSLGLAVVADLESGRVRHDTGTCGQVGYATAITRDGSRGYLGGSASGVPACGAMLRIGDEVSMHRTIFLGLPWPDNRAIALSPDDSLMAWGFSDGTVWVYTADTLEPVQSFRPFQSEVRGLSFTSAGLVAVSRHGEVVRMEVDADRGGAEGLHKRATERLATATRLGLR